MVTRKLCPRTVSNSYLCVVVVAANCSVAEEKVESVRSIATKDIRGVAKTTKSQQSASSIRAASVVQKTSKVRSKLSSIGIESIRAHIHALGVLVILFLLVHHPALRPSKSYAPEIDFRSCMSGEPCMFDKEMVRERALEVLASKLDELSMSVAEQTKMIEVAVTSQNARDEAWESLLTEIDSVLSE